QPIWLGIDKLQNKTILLHSEQGLGDTIQCCRYARLVAERGAKVVLEVPKPLMGLLQGLAGVSELGERGSTLPAFDGHCHLLSLPLAFKTRIESIPNPGPYLRASREKKEFWAGKLGNKLQTRVGLVWSGALSNERGWHRNIKLESLLPYLPDGFDYVSLQME